ncbi:MAG: hypothetical protein VB108_05595 [Anaerolineaceae bacterium]|nr:hypothetical protein [Anaerolineaceae bacterium]
MKKTYFSTFQLILIALLSSLIVVAKIGLRMPIKLSGHSGFFWMAIIIIAAGVVPKRGAASLTGFFSGILAVLLGLGGFGPLDTFLSYFALGLGTDLALWLLGSPEKIPVAILAAIIGHLCKFLVKWGFAVFAGAPLGLVALGLGLSMGSYILFGGLGGLLGALALRALRKAGFFKLLEEKK